MLRVWARSHMGPVDALGQGMRAGSWLPGREGPRELLSWRIPRLLCL